MAKYKRALNCGCVVAVDYNEMPMVIYCPKHKAAPEMYEALSTLNGWVSKPDAMRLGCSVSAIRTLLQPILAKAARPRQGKEESIVSGTKTILTESRPGGIVTKITEWRPEGRTQ